MGDLTSVTTMCMQWPNCDKKYFWGSLTQVQGGPCTINSPNVKSAGFKGDVEGSKVTAQLRNGKQTAGVVALLFPENITAINVMEFCRYSSINMDDKANPLPSPWGPV